MKFPPLPTFNSGRDTLENQRLQEELEKAHIIIDVQKKWPRC